MIINRFCLNGHEKFEARKVSPNLGLKNWNFIQSAVQETPEETNLKFKISKTVKLV